jgi:hypothetical protein
MKIAPKSPFDYGRTGRFEAGDARLGARLVKLMTTVIPDKGMQLLIYNIS